MKYLATLIVILLFVSGKIFSLPIVKISTIENPNTMLNANSTKSQIISEDIFRQLGYFYVFRDFPDLKQKVPDVEVLMNIYVIDRYFVGEIKITANNPLYKHLEKGIRVHSRFINNIPILIAREITAIHEDLFVQVYFTPISEDTLNKYLINFGTYSPFYDDAIIHILSEIGTDAQFNKSGRYHTIITTNKNIGNKSVKYYPQNQRKYRLGDQIKFFDTILFQQNLREFSNKEINQSTEAKHKYTTALAIVNPLSNVFIPGFGSYMSTGYIGFTDPDISYINVGLTSTTYIYQLFYVPYLHGFDINSFWPWSKETVLDENMQNIQKYNLLTIPYTFTISFLDHLTIQYMKNEALPPFFHTHDLTASVLSTIVPGAGYYYKGYRSIGLPVYASQFILGSLVVSNYKSGDHKNYLYTLGAMRIIDIAGAYFIRHNYKHFTSLQDRSHTTEFVFEPALTSLYELEKDKPETYYRIGLKYLF